MEAAERDANFSNTSALFPLPCSLFPIIGSPGVHRDSRELRLLNETVAPSTKLSLRGGVEPPPRILDDEEDAACDEVRADVGGGAAGPSLCFLPKEKIEARLRRGLLIDRTLPSIASSGICRFCLSVIHRERLARW